MRQHGLAARARVAGDQPLNVDGGGEQEAIERGAPGQIVRPAVGRQEALRGVLAQPRGRGVEHRALGGGGRARGVGEAVDRGIAVGRDQRGERLHEVERRAVEPCPVARVDVLLGAPPPSLAARNQLQLDDPLGTERHRHRAARVLRRRGHEDARAALEGGRDLGAPHDLPEVRRADLFLPLRHEDEVDRALPARAVDGMESGQERGLRTFLVHRAAADQDLAEAGLVDERRRPGRRRPLGGIDLLDVIHEVQADRPRRAGVQCREDAGLAVGGDAGDLLEAGLPREAHHEVAPLGHPPPLGGDRRLPHPFLEACDALPMAPGDLRLNRVEAIVGPQDLWKSERGRGRGRGTEELATGEWAHEGGV